MKNRQSEILGSYSLWKFPCSLGLTNDNTYQSSTHHIDTFFILFLLYCTSYCSHYIFSHGNFYFMTITYHVFCFYFQMVGFFFWPVISIHESILKEDWIWISILIWNITMYVTITIFIRFMILTLVDISINMI